MVRNRIYFDRNSIFSLCNNVQTSNSTCTPTCKYCCKGTKCQGQFECYKVYFVVLFCILGLCVLLSLILLLRVLCKYRKARRIFTFWSKHKLNKQGCVKNSIERLEYDGHLRSSCSLPDGQIREDNKQQDSSFNHTSQLKYGNRDVNRIKRLNGNLLECENPSEERFIHCQQQPSSTSLLEMSSRTATKNHQKSSTNVKTSSFETSFQNSQSVVPLHPMSQEYKMITPRKLGSLRDSAPPDEMTYEEPSKAQTSNMFERFAPNHQEPKEENKSNQLFDMNQFKIRTQVRNRQSTGGSQVNLCNAERDSHANIQNLRINSQNASSIYLSGETDEYNPNSSNPGPTKVKQIKKIRGKSRKPVKKEVPLRRTDEHLGSLDKFSPKNKEFNSIIDLSFGEPISIIPHQEVNLDDSFKGLLKKSIKEHKSDEHASAPFGMFFDRDIKVIYENEDEESSSDENQPRSKEISKGSVESSNKVEAFENSQIDQTGGETLRKEVLSLVSTPYTLTSHANVRSVSSEDQSKKKSISNLIRSKKRRVIKKGAKLNQTLV
ncbi:unnamed protein product [Moneuplotes crassus]|uniref:Uncharacterized protein n=1 Tax=Euplotes crassus TaxID=5936 RepID=A0AAD1U5A9_EUPCR|nr:unnamed protein product [Moneuplotes crassus]